MCDEIRVDQDHQDRGRAPDERLDILQRYDGLIAEAEGDALLQEFWCLSKPPLYQEGTERLMAQQLTVRPGGGLLADLNELCDRVEMRAGSPIRTGIQLRGFTGHVPQPRCHRLCGITMGKFGWVMGVARKGFRHGS